MKDFFDEPTAMHEQDQSAAHNLLIEAMAELNRGEKTNEETLAIHRAAGEKFLKIRDTLGIKSWLDWIVKRSKRSMSQVKRIIQLAEASPALPVDAQMAILWGYKPKEPKAEASGGDVADKPDKPVEPKQIWKHVNGIVEGVGTLVNAGNLQADEAYIGVRDTIKDLRSHLRAFIKKAEGK